jgi:hypothetical protein
MPSTRRPRGGPGAFLSTAGSFGLMMGAIVFLAGLILVWTGGQAAHQEQRYRDAAAIVPAQVVEKSMQPATSQTGTRYEVTYRAVLPDASPAERTETIDVVEWDRLERGSELTVQYLADQPESIRIAREPRIAGHIAAFAIGGVLAPIGVVLVSLGARDVWRRRRLYYHGTGAVATVVAVEETNVRINRRPRWRIRFSYRDHRGQERRGQSGYLGDSEAHEWSPGDTATVHFDPHRPEQVLWMGERSANR